MWLHAAKIYIFLVMQKSSTILSHAASVLKVVDEIGKGLPYGFESGRVNVVNGVMCGVPAVEETIASHINDVDAWNAGIVDHDMVVGDCSTVGLNKVGPIAGLTCSVPHQLHHA